MRARLLGDGRLRDATLLVVLGYAGLRPQEALALEWRHVRERTLLVERALSDGQLKALKNRRQPRTVELLAPLQEDLTRGARPRARGTDRTGLPGGLRRVLAGDRLAELAQAHLQADRGGGRHRRRAAVRPSPRVRVTAHPRGTPVGSEIAAQLGHNPTVCLDTYAHVMAEQAGGERVSAQEQIALARNALEQAAPVDAQLSFAGLEP